VYTKQADGDSVKSEKADGRSVSNVGNDNSGGGGGDSANLHAKKS